MPFLAILAYLQHCLGISAYFTLNLAHRYVIEPCLGSCVMNLPTERLSIAQIPFSLSKEPTRIT